MLRVSALEGVQALTTLIKNGLVIDPANLIQAKLNLLLEDGKIKLVTRDEPDADLSRGLGDVYKRQGITSGRNLLLAPLYIYQQSIMGPFDILDKLVSLSLIHI